MHETYDTAALGDGELLQSNHVSLASLGMTAIPDSYFDNVRIYEIVAGRSTSESGPYKRLRGSMSARRADWGISFASQ